MESKNFSFSVFNKYVSDGIVQSLCEFNPKKQKPLFICIGSDLVLGDSLGPLVGTFLKRNKLETYVYGTLNMPITAKEVEYAKTYIKQMHPASLIIAIDAAVGAGDDIGLIKVQNRGLKPGLGVNKNLGVIGDLSIVGVVASKSLQNYNLFNLTRLNLVFRMAEAISSGITDYVAYLSDGKTSQTGLYGAS